MPDVFETEERIWNKIHKFFTEKWTWKRMVLWIIIMMLIRGTVMCVARLNEPNETEKYWEESSVITIPTPPSPDQLRLYRMRPIPTPPSPDEFMLPSETGNYTEKYWEREENSVITIPTPSSPDELRLYRMLPYPYPDVFILP